MTAARPVFNLNLFSNVASPDPARCLAGHAARSAIDALAPEATHRLVIRVFCDPNPNPDAFDAWCRAAGAGLPGHEVEIHRSAGLADGWRRSIELAEGACALQLEHDFVLLGRRIPHRLDTILAAMRAGAITHLRFNKRWNRPVGYDAFMEPEDPGVPVCRVSGRSNNPHIVDVAHARRHVLPWIDPDARGAEGLEGRVELFAGGGHVYGPLGHPATAGHLDGRSLRWRDALRRRLWLAREAA